MRCRGLVIQPRGEYELRDFNSMEDIRAAVGSDNVDWSAPVGLVFYCYGFALYEKPINPVATELYWLVNPGARHSAQQLAGPIVVTGLPVNSEETDIPSRAVRMFMKIRKDMGPEEINRRAVPLSDAERTKLKAAQDQLWAGVHEQLLAGGAVDVGGIIIGRLPEDE